jgi:alkylresorcinol/alkylpyrone synthase
MNDQKQACMSSLSVAVPDFSIGQKDAFDFVKKHYTARLSSRSMNVLEKVFSHPSIKNRYFAVEDPLLFIDEDPDKRIERFTKYAVELSTRAVYSALEKSNTAGNDVSALVVNTCTGYICPGISTYLVEKLGFPSNTLTYDLVGSGCGGAIPNMLLSRSLSSGRNSGAVVSVSVEICSATFQMENDMSLLISNALFGDGAAASVWDNSGRGLSLVDSEAVHMAQYREHIRFVHRNGQLYNQLSYRLPELVAKPVAELIRKLIERNGLALSDIKHWAIHPGGEKVINALKDEIGLNEDCLTATRSVLSNYGNMSSPSVLFILENIGSKIGKGEYCIMVAFGAGFSAYACLLSNI